MTPGIHTFSIVAWDPAAKEWGIGVQSKFLAVGSAVPWAIISERPESGSPKRTRHGSELPAPRTKSTRVP